ncbi:MAG: 2-oxoglutarate dehydrogenase E1 component [Betaproteobacteria bacterium]|nr:2-oxoglutarate dehydrogenase E1 component [Betaproteobacteria bacterium]
MDEMLGNSFIYDGNAPFVEELYELYLNDPALVSEEWRCYFDLLQQAPGNAVKDVPHSAILQSFAERAKQPCTPVPASDVEALVNKQISVLQLINAYRFRGVRQATVDPLKRQQQPEVPELNPEFYGLTDADLSHIFKSGSLIAPEQSTLHDILRILRETYCGNIGTEYMHIADTTQKRWIQERLETNRAHPQFTPDGKRHILEQLSAAETLEKYLHTRYVGQKRFSLEGGESLIPLLDHLIQRSGSQGVKEIVIGMAHRGRLNVLVNTIGKLPSDLFLEFEGKHAANSKLASGDVKYHQGFSTDVATPGGPMHLTLAFNPSHLEIVNPVVEGSVRARQQRRHDLAGNQVIPVLIHGDAAFSGQGVVMETLNLSQTRGYGTGGTVHIVINNQIGFTTSDPRDTRSTLYCTDVAKMVGAPIFHVNGDDPEAVLLVTEIALDYRMAFHKDVVVDLVCFRKLGHNEQDEPLVTQPLMYKKIAQHPGTRKLYADRLVAERVLESHDPEEMVAAYRRDLDAGVSITRTVLSSFKRSFATDWSPFVNGKWNDPANTAVPMVDLQRLSGVLTSFPADFKLHSRVEKIIADRRQMGEGRLPLDWGMAENLAYASLLENGFAVRLSGQDSGRGTFFHRHAVLHDQNREKWDAGIHIPLQNISAKQPHFLVIDSVLSEEAVLGFEYGYSSAEPNELVIWEAQFGDFANGAQVAIDQFISAGEAKWGRLCGLVMLLPHGYEGQGPEHSSARLERYLQLCAEENIQVCVPSTPAQIFHLLRRQMVRAYRKPLIVMTPKSLLRHKDAVSLLENLASGQFYPVIGEVDAVDPDQVTRVVACSGKVYYDLLAARREGKLNHAVIVRIEQLYPFPAAEFTAELKRYKKARELVWAQEEPMNQGAWYQTQHHLRECLSARQQLVYAGRPASASPAVGYMAKHQEQQRALVEAALHSNK